jgi:hypothetical protein
MCKTFPTVSAHRDHVCFDLLCEICNSIFKRIVRPDIYCIVFKILTPELLQIRCRFSITFEKGIVLT